MTDTAVRRLSEAMKASLDAPERRKGYIGVAQAILAADPQLAEAIELGLAFAAVTAALPEGYELMLGHTLECRFCSGWWATASKRLEDPPHYPQIISSETGRPRGEHHDATPTAALLALATKPGSPTDE